MKKILIAAVILFSTPMWAKAEKPLTPKMLCDHTFKFVPPESAAYQQEYPICIKVFEAIEKGEEIGLYGFYAYFVAMMYCMDFPEHSACESFNKKDK